MSIFKKELPAKKLHPEQGKNEDEDKQQKQERNDGANGVDQGHRQVAHRLPILGQLEQPQQPEGPHGGDAHPGAGDLDDDGFHDRSHDDDEVEDVEIGVKIPAETDGDHLEDDLDGEQDEKAEIGVKKESPQPIGHISVTDHSAE